MMRHSLVLGLCGMIACTTTIDGSGPKIDPPPGEGPEDGDETAVLHHGESFTLTGHGFGVKDPVEPLRYLDFEDGTIGTRLRSQAEGGFATLDDFAVFPHYVRFPDGDPRLAGDDPNLVGEERIPGEIVIKQTYMRDGYGAANQTVGLFGIDVSNLYTSAWIYRYDVSGNAEVSDNQKLWGNFGHDGAEEGPYGYPQCRVDTYWGADGDGHLYVADDASQILLQRWGLGDTKFLNQWMRAERFMRQGTRDGGDGLTWVAANLRELQRLEGTLYTVGELYNYWIFGHFFRLENSGLTPPPPAEMIQYIGEMYVDTVQARVEIGDAPVWSDCTHREIQIPQNIWQDDRLEFRVNRGSFTSGSTVNIFVVDHEGVPSAGVPIRVE